MLRSLVGSEMCIRDSNNTEASKQRIDALDVGSFTIDYDVPASAARGVWRVEVDADGIGRVGSKSFSVEDFVPQRLEVSLEVDEAKPIRPDDERQVLVESRFLYGAPAAGLTVESEARLKLDPNPFPEFTGYRYGPIEGRFNQRFIRLPETTTDADGKAAFPLAIEDMPKKLGAPLRADLVVGVVEPGGRVVRESARVPVRSDDAYVGVKLATEGGGFGQDEPVNIDAVLIDWEGKSQADAELEWRLV